MNVSGLGSLFGITGDLLGGAVGGNGGTGLASLAGGLLSGGGGSAGGASPLGGLASLAERLLGSGSDPTSSASSDPFSAIEALTGGVDELATSGLASLLGGAGGLGSIAGLLA